MSGLLLLLAFVAAIVGAAGGSPFGLDRLDWLFVVLALYIAAHWPAVVGPTVDGWRRSP